MQSGDSQSGEKEAGKGKEKGRQKSRKRHREGRRDNSGKQKSQRQEGSRGCEKHTDMTEAKRVRDEGRA